MALELSPDRPPIPPADLVLRVTPSFDADSIEAGLASFDLHALRHLHAFERALGLVDRTFSDFERLLDFGCGCGRFIRHFGPLADQVEVHGTDIDAEMIGWLRDNIPYGHYAEAAHVPPLPYPDHYFDLVINHSVFTHLDEHFQDLWLEELRRVSAPGALLLLTVEGTSRWNWLSDAHGPADPLLARWRTELQSRGIVFVNDDTFIGSTHPEFYHSTYHAPWYIFEHWTRFFDLVAYLPDCSDTQDLVMMRRRPDGAQPPVPIPSRPKRAQLSQDGVAESLRVAYLRARRYLRLRRELRPVLVDRELRMLRAALYEQSSRMSVIAAELRREIAARDRAGDRRKNDAAE